MQQSGPAELVLTNARIVTMDSQDRTVEAVAVGEERITATGSAQEIEAFVGERTGVIDLRGATVLPGLIDTHTHVSLAADGRSYVQLFSQADELMALAGVANLRRHLEAGVTTMRDNGARNMVGVAMTNYAAPQQNGHSIAFDAVAFDENGDARDTLIIEAGEAEGVYLAQFDMDKIRAYREREVWGNAFRRPHRYHLLTSEP